MVESDVWSPSPRSSAMAFFIKRSMISLFKTLNFTQK
jgi:hypothetical protein